MVVSGVVWGTPTARGIVAAATLGSGLTLLDGTVVNVALRSIGADLDASLAQLQWITNGYFLSMASLILIGGSLGDRLGRRRVFVIGTVWFALASLLCGLAPNAEVLIAARVLQGIGGALLTPGSLAMIQGAFRSEDRSRAIGAWSGLGGIAAALGPLVGGLLAAFFVAIFPGNVAQYVEGVDAFGLDTDRARLVRLFFQPVLVLWALWGGGWLARRRTDD